MDASPPLLVLLVLTGVVILGTGMQRIAGLGFALVASPPFVLLLGPVLGVVFVNVCGVVVAAALAVRSRTDIDWRRVVILTASALAGIIPGAFVVALLPRAWLDVLIGVLIVLGVGTSIAARSGLDSDHRGPLAVAGVVSGAMNVTAGIGGPALAIYGVLTGWMGRGFAATIQPVFFATGTASVVAKFAIEPPSAEVWNPLVWILLIGGCIVGMLAGELLGRRMTPGVARVLLLVIALGGAIVVLVRGLLAVSGLAPPAD